MQNIKLQGLDEKQNQALNEILPYIPALDADALSNVSFEKGIRIKCGNVRENFI